jgi:hypothetical protein
VDAKRKYPAAKRIFRLTATRPPAHEVKLLGAHFFSLLRGKKGAPRVYPWPARKPTPLYVQPIIKDTLPYQLLKKDSTFTGKIFSKVVLSCTSFSCPRQISASKSTNKIGNQPWRPRI